MDKKIVVINYSGNVGKSTISQHLLAPRLQAPLIPMESINSDGYSSADGEDRVYADEYGEVLQRLVKMKSAVLDVGSSNAEEFIKRMQQYHGSHRHIDYFVVPVVNDDKQQKDTGKTIHDLAQLGVPPHKILLVMNQVGVRDRVRKVFDGLVAMAAVTKSFVFNDKAVIYKNELFTGMNTAKLSVPGLLADKTDWDAKVRAAKNEEEADEYTRLMCLQMLAVTVNQNLNSVYGALFQEEALQIAA